jgi:hypothetical protein
MAKTYDRSFHALLETRMAKRYGASSEHSIRQGCSLCRRGFRFHWLRLVEARYGHDALLTQLPVNAISTLSAWDGTGLSKEFWLRHAPRLATLKQTRLFPKAVGASKEMQDADAPSNGLPPLPQLANIILENGSLTALRTYCLCDTFVKRIEQGAPLEALGLRTCIATERTIQLLTDAVSGVQGSADTLETRDRAFFNWMGGVEFFNEEEKRVG